MRLKTQIEMQTGLEPGYQELFFENLPYQPQGQVHASKLPTTSVCKWFAPCTYIITELDNEWLNEEQCTCMWLQSSVS